jgi:hypothetical protein
VTCDSTSFRLTNGSPGLKGDDMVGIALPAMSKLQRSPTISSVQKSTWPLRDPHLFAPAESSS